MQDVWIYRIVVGALAFIGVAVVLGIVAIAMTTGSTVRIPEALIALGSTAIGVLGGILSPLTNKGKE